MSDLSNLPFDEDGSSNNDFCSDGVVSSSGFREPLGDLGPTQNDNPPIYIFYQNHYTLSEGSMEIPEPPVRAALNNNRPVVVYWKNDIGKVYATRWDNENEIKHHVIGKRFLPHFPSATPAMRALNPNGFFMCICRIDFREFVELSNFPDESTKLKLERKTKSK